MRFMIIVKATKDSEADVMPEEKLIAAMATYHEELAKEGALLDASGLKSRSKGWRIKYSGGKRTVIDGPFGGIGKTFCPFHRLFLRVHLNERVAGDQLLGLGGRWQGGRDRDPPALRAGGLRSQRGD